LARRDQAVASGGERGYGRGVDSISAEEGNEQLPELVARVERDRAVVEITRDGRVVAVLVSSDELESLRETAFWKSQAGVREDAENAKREDRDDTTVSGEEVRVRHGL
jgi:prevent-host-death family protein